MTSPIRTERHDNVLVVISDNPPVNALGQAVRAGLKDAIAEALADDGVEAVVIRCDGQTFFAGADITEFGKPPMEPFLPNLCNPIEASPLLVVASMHGVSLGGGLEVALSAHYRIAQPSARVGLPEVHLGLIPCFEISLKLASRLLSDGWVGLNTSCCRCHFRAFQLELDNLGTKNFEIGSVVKKLQPFEVGRILENSGASETFRSGLAG